MRSKEGSSDYRYFPDPDLGPIEVSNDLKEKWRSELPELPAAKRNRYSKELGLSIYDARVLTDESSMAQYFEQVVNEGGAPKSSTNWITGDLAAYIKSNRLSFDEILFKPKELAEMLKMIDAGEISGKIAKIDFWLFRQRCRNKYYHRPCHHRRNRDAYRFRCN